MELLHNQKGVLCTVLNERFIFARKNNCPLLIQLNHHGKECCIKHFYYNETLNKSSSSLQGEICHLMCYPNPIDNKVYQFFNPIYIWLNGKPSYLKDVEDGTELLCDAISIENVGFLAIVVWQGFKPHFTPVLASNELILNQNYLKLPAEEISFRDSIFYVHVTIDNEKKKIPFPHQSVFIDGRHSVSMTETYKLLFSSSPLLVSLCRLLPSFHHEQSPVYHCFSISCGNTISLHEKAFQPGCIFLMKDGSLISQDLQKRSHIFYDVHFKQTIVNDLIKISFQIYGENYIFNYSNEESKPKVEEGIAHVLVEESLCFLLVTKVLNHQRNIQVSNCENSIQTEVFPEKCVKKKKSVNLMIIEGSIEVVESQSQKNPDHESYKIASVMLPKPNTLQTSFESNSEVPFINHCNIKAHELTDLTLNNPKPKTIGNHKDDHKQESIDKYKCEAINNHEQEITTRSESLNPWLSEETETSPQSLKHLDVKLLFNKLGLLTKNDRGEPIIKFENKKDQVYQYKISVNFVFSENVWHDIKSVRYPCSVYFDALSFPSIDSLFILLLWLDNKPTHAKFGEYSFHVNISGIVTQIEPFIIIKGKVKKNRNMKLSGKFKYQLFDHNGLPYKYASIGSKVGLMVQRQHSNYEYEIVYGIVTTVSDNKACGDNILQAPIKISNETGKINKKSNMASTNLNYYKASPMNGILNGLYLSQSIHASLEKFWEFPTMPTNEILTSTNGISVDSYELSKNPSNLTKILDSTNIITKTVSDESLRKTSKNSSILQTNSNVGSTDNVEGNKKLLSFQKICKTHLEYFNGFCIVENAKLALIGTKDNIFIVKKENILLTLNVKIKDNDSILYMDDQVRLLALKLAQPCIYDTWTITHYCVVAWQGLKASYVDKIEAKIKTFLAQFSTYSQVEKSIISFIKSFSQEQMPQKQPAKNLCGKDSFQLKLTPQTTGSYSNRCTLIFKSQTGHVLPKSQTGHVLPKSSNTFTISDSTNCNTSQPPIILCFKYNMPGFITNKGKICKSTRLSSIIQKFTCFNSLYGLEIYPCLEQNFTIVSISSNQKNFILKEHGMSVPIEHFHLIHLFVPDEKLDNMINQVHSSIKISNSTIFPLSSVYSIDHKIFHIVMGKVKFLLNDDGILDVPSYYLNKNQSSYSVFCYFNKSVLILDMGKKAMDMKLESPFQNDLYYKAAIYQCKKHNIFGTDVNFCVSLLWVNKLSESVPFKYILPPLYSDFNLEVENFFSRTLDSQNSLKQENVATLEAEQFPFCGSLPTLQFENASEIDSKAKLMYFAEGRVSFIDSTDGFLIIPSHYVNSSNISEVFCYFNTTIIKDLSIFHANQPVYLKAFVYKCEQQLVLGRKIQYCVATLWRNSLSSDASFKYIYPYAQTNFYQDIANILSLKLQSKSPNQNESTNIVNYELSENKLSETTPQAISPFPPDDTLPIFEDTTKLSETLESIKEATELPKTLQNFAETPELSKTLQSCEETRELSETLQNIAETSELSETFQSCEEKREPSETLQCTEESKELSESFKIFEEANKLSEIFQSFEETRELSETLQNIAETSEFSETFQSYEEQRELSETLQCTEESKELLESLKSFEEIDKLSETLQSIEETSETFQSCEETTELSETSPNIKENKELSETLPSFEETTELSEIEKIKETAEPAESRPKISYFVEDAKVTHFNGNVGILSVCSVNPIMPETDPLVFPCFFNKQCIYLVDEKKKKITDIMRISQNLFEKQASFNAVIYQCEKSIAFGQEINLCVLIFWNDVIPMPENINITHTLPQKQLHFCKDMSHIWPTHQKNAKSLEVGARTEFPIHDNAKNNRFGGAKIKFIIPDDKILNFTVLKKSKNLTNPMGLQTSENTDISAENSQTPVIGSISLPPLNKDEAQKGIVFELESTYGKFITRTGATFQFSRERCFLFGLRLSSFSLKDVIRQGHAVFFETNSCGVVEKVCIGDASPMTAEEMYNKIEEWCNIENILKGPKLKLLHACDWIPSSCNPISNIDSYTPVVTLD